MLLDDGRELRYADPRRFGRMAYLAGELLSGELQRFGADPLEVGLEGVCGRIHGRKARESRRCCWTRAFCAAWEIFMLTKACGKPRFIRRSWAGD